MAANSNGESQAQSSLPLIQSLVSGDREGVGGIICNDSSGLCLLKEGSGLDASNSAVYASLVRLASQLSPQQQSPDTSPLITLEYDDAAILVKEYDRHTVALRVPSSSGQAANNSIQGSSSERSTASS